MESRFDCLHINDYADMASRNSPQMLFEMLPFGRDPASLTGPIGTGKSSPPTMSFTAAALGFPADEIVSSSEFAITKNRVTVAAGTLEAGTIGGMRMNIAAIHKGQRVLTRSSTWYVTKDLEPQWELLESGVHFRVEGDLPLAISVTIPVSPEAYPKISPAMTANPVVNAVPYICDAKPGILHTDELPLIVGKFAPR
jgi:4-hydroxy-tetrahydrodipicolinate reductase